MDEHTASEQAYKRGYEQGKQDAMKWIPVTERLPMYNVDVLVYRPKMAMKVLVSSYEMKVITAKMITSGTKVGQGTTRAWVAILLSPTGCHFLVHPARRYQND